MLALAVASACSHSTSAPRRTAAPLPIATQRPAEAPRVAPATPVRANATELAVRVTPSPEPTGAVIYSASANPRIAHAGDEIVWSVRTSRAVSSVAAKSAGFTIPLEKRAPGVFGLAFRIPKEMPPLFRGTYAVTIEARTASGSAATSQLSLNVQ